MGYVGTAPLSGDYRKLDDISSGFNGSTTGFTLQVGSVNVTPPKETTLLISVGGILQEPITAYTVSGSTITFTAAPESGADFFGVMLGEATTIGTPSDGTISAAKVENTFISGQTEITSGLDAADELLYSDGGTIKRVGLDTLATKFAGTGISASSGVLNLDTITSLGTIAAGVWQGTAITSSYINASQTGITAVGTLSSLVIGDAGTIGSESDTDALAISAGGVVNFTQAPTVASAAIKTAGVEDMWIPAAAMTPTATAGCADIESIETTAGRPDMRVLDFDASTQEYAQFSVAMPKSWNGSTITAEFYWTTTATDTDACIWGIQGLTVSNDETIDQVYGTAQLATDNVISGAEEVLISPTTNAVTLAGGTPAAGDLAFFQVYRDADDGSDTMAEDARLIGVKIHYTTNAATDA